MAGKPSGRAAMLLGAKVVISVALFAWLFHRVQWSNIVVTIERARPEWLAAAFGLLVLSNLFGAYQWNRLMRAVGIQLPFWKVCAYYHVGLFFNNFLPANVGGDLARIFNFLGEEKHAGRIAHMIVDRRQKQPFERTLDLADAIATHIGRGPKDKIHPATRVFQALRIYVNDELGELARALIASERILKPNGRLVVVSFHSLEDRIVKRFIADRSETQGGSRHMPQVVNRAATFQKLGGAVSASEAEPGSNPRSGSAELGAAARTDAPARTGDLGLFDLPKLPELQHPAEL